MATKFVPLDLSGLNEANLKNIDFVKGKFNEASQAVTLRDTEIQRLADVNVDLQRQFSAAETLAKTRDAELASARRELATQAGRIQELSDKLVQFQTSTPKIGVQDLVNHFKSNIDLINADVISRKTSGMLVDSVEVEVRGGIDVSDGLHITQLPPSALGVQSVSVLKFNLRPTSALKIVEDDEGAAPR